MLNPNIPTVSSLSHNGGSCLEWTLVVPTGDEQPAANRR
jgi:hypothetical protein